MFGRFIRASWLETLMNLIVRGLKCASIMFLLGNLRLMGAAAIDVKVLKRASFPALNILFFFV